MDKLKDLPISSGVGMTGEQYEQSIERNRAQQHRMASFMRKGALPVGLGCGIAGIVLIVIGSV